MTIGAIKPAVTQAVLNRPADKLAAAPGFAEHLKASIMSANSLQNQSTNAQIELATGQGGNIHETLIAMNKASVSFQMIKEVRNKIITAYQEIMRMQT